VGAASLLCGCVEQQVPLGRRCKWQQAAWGMVAETPAVETALVLTALGTGVKDLGRDCPPGACQHSGSAWGRARQQQDMVGSSD